MNESQHFWSRPVIVVEVIAVVVVGLAACGTYSSSDGPVGSSVEVSRADFGKDWPLTVESGTLTCQGVGSITFTTGGTTYAVNGFAGAEHKYADLKAIWAKDPSGMVPRKSIAPLIQRGEKLCS